MYQSVRDTCVHSIYTAQLKKNIYQLSSLFFFFFLNKLRSRQYLHEKVITATNRLLINLSTPETFSMRKPSVVTQLYPSNF